MRVDRVRKTSGLALGLALLFGCSEGSVTVAPPPLPPVSGEVLITVPPSVDEGQAFTAQISLRGEFQDWASFNLPVLLGDGRVRVAKPKADLPEFGTPILSGGVAEQEDSVLVLAASVFGRATAGLSAEVGQEIPIGALEMLALTAIPDTSAWTPLVDSMTVTNSTGDPLRMNVVVLTTGTLLASVDR